MRVTNSYGDMFHISPCAYLSGAYLSHANLYGAKLSDADLSHAYLSHANLSDADLIDADVSDSNLSGANMSGANLSGTIFFNAAGNSVCGRVLEIGRVGRYNVLVIDNDRIQIGREQHSVDDWDNMTMDQIYVMDGDDAVAWANEHLANVINMVRGTKVPCTDVDNLSKAN